MPILPRARVFRPANRPAFDKHSRRARSVRCRLDRTVERRFPIFPPGKLTVSRAGAECRRTPERAANQKRNRPLGLGSAHFDYSSLNLRIIVELAVMVDNGAAVTIHLRCG